MSPTVQAPLLLIATTDDATFGVALHACERIGWRVLHASDEAHLHELAVSERPSLVLLGLGDDSTRARSCRALVERLREAPAPIFVLMRQISEGLIASAYDAGATEVIGLPIRWPLLIPRLQRMFAHAGEAGDPPREPSTPSAVVSADEAGPDPADLREELERHRRTLRNVQRIARLGTWIYDYRSGEMEWSDQTFQLLGLPTGEIATFESLSLCLHPADRERVVEGFLSTNALGQPLVLVCRVVLPSGGVRHVQLRGERPESGESVMQGTIQDVTQQQRSQEKIRRLAHVDGLTGLANRRRFMEQLERARERAWRSGGAMALLYLDLDQFKRINDTLGHSAGDEVLRTVAEVLFDNVRPTDLIARPSDGEDPEISRLGGDEFAILLTEISSRDDARRVAERILVALPKPIQVEGHAISSTGSIGIAVYPDDGDDVETLLKHADRALYHAKEEGRNNYEFFSEALNAGALKRLTMESRLRNAIETQTLRLFYQPRFDVVTERVVAAEALMRWTDSELGSVSPREFIVTAEETGLIIPLGAWALGEACRQSMRWAGAGLRQVPISVNVSTAQFRRDDLVGTVADALAKSGLSPTLLELEITESLMLQDDDDAATALRELRAMGIRVALDDFGTGYSSLSYLARYPLDALKLDRSLVRDVANDPHARDIAAAMISMAHLLGLDVVAEGVDQREQLDFLKEQRCNEVQGWLLAEALPPADFARFLTVEAKEAAEAKA